MSRPTRPGEHFVRGSYDDPTLLEQLSYRRQKTTPDWIERKMEEYIPVFVYGTLRRGFPNHNYLMNYPSLGSGYTTIEKYEMRQTNGGGFPVVFEREPKIKGRKRNPVVGKVQGEVYIVDPKGLLYLDRLEGNGRMYQRSLQWIFLQDQEGKGYGLPPSVKCWIYLGVEDFWKHSGAPETCASSTKNGVKYYDWADEYEATPLWMSDNTEDVNSSNFRWTM